MKSLLLVVCVVSFAGYLAAQNSVKVAPIPAAADTYDLGGRAVRVPAPEKFTDTMVLYPRIAGRLIAGESPLNEVLAVHVTDDILPQIKNGEEPDLPFFAKVSVSKRLKAEDVEASDFQTLVAEFEKQSPGLLQSIVKTGEKGAGERLSNHWGGDVSLKFGETRMLGYFDKQPRSISSMFLMNLEMFNRKLVIVGSMSLVHVNKRIIFLYVFRIPSSSTDQEMVADLTKYWTAKTVAANK